MKGEIVLMDTDNHDNGTGDSISAAHDEGGAGDEDAEAVLEENSESVRLLPQNDSEANTGPREQGADEHEQADGDDSPEISYDESPTAEATKRRQKATVDAAAAVGQNNGKQARLKYPGILAALDEELEVQNAVDRDQDRNKEDLVWSVILYAARDGQRDRKLVAGPLRYSLQRAWMAMMRRVAEKAAGFVRTGDVVDSDCDSDDDDDDDEAGGGGTKAKRMSKKKAAETAPTMVVKGGRLTRSQAAGAQRQTRSKTGAAKNRQAAATSTAMTSTKTTSKKRKAAPEEAEATPKRLKAGVAQIAEEEKLPPSSSSSSSSASRPDIRSLRGSRQMVMNPTQV